MLQKRKNADSLIGWVVQHLFTQIWYCCSLLVALSSCDRADPMYRDKEIGQGVVQIYPDGSQHTLPALQYHFYNTSRAKNMFVYPCDGVGNFDGTLPVGSYHVIATNTNAAHTLFSGMDSYETAIVMATTSESARSAAAVRSGLTFLAQPGHVYSTVLSGLMVVADNSAHAEPQPVLLTKQLNFTFSLHDGLDTEIIAMTGVLSGIYPAVHLYTHQGVQIENSPTTAIRFETIGEGSERQAQVFLFGLYDPAYGTNYTNEMELTLTMNDGSNFTVIQDLTNILSDIIRESEGVIPLELSLPIQLTKTPIGVQSEVIGWIEEGGKEIEI